MNVQASQFIPTNGRGAFRSGADFLANLASTPRSVFVDGERVSDPSEHPAFREAARQIAGLYDFAFAPENLDIMTYVEPETGWRALRCFQIPKTHADLAAKRVAAEKWAEQTFGLMGRTPDHVANFFTGYAAKPSVFAKSGPQYAERVVNFYKHLRDNHLYVAYAIVPPQIDRSKSASKQSEPDLYAGVVREVDGGIIVKGGQQLATGGVFADYLHISSIHPLQPGDEAYAISVAIPMSAPGLKLYSRRAFAQQATNAFDYPLSSRFDETDSFVVLDDVFVPWEHVFIYRDIELCRDQWWKTPSHTYGNHQAQARFATKLRFLLGMAKKMNEATGNDSAPPVMVQMGELAALASIVEGMHQAQEALATFDDEGVLWPSKSMLYAVMALQGEINPRMIDIVRELTGAAMISLPSSVKDFDNPEAAEDIARFYRSSNMSARDRVALMRLAWDFIGTEFGNRHQQYEKFYGGASFIVKMNMFRAYDFKRAGALVDRALTLPPVEGA
ncbi:4-hydroxyphenylacetate 3-hydroxylase [Tardiphaga sp. vice154]|uniref:4-hydroxyphenylacetate 3-hydroxylase family protein n=1 Tax=Tardiphaga sp. vice154 TaxID=2592814 RepID=UPI0011631CC1|nr:4-hydroxyphenylacetate 3-hydroxylase N-terminal domain-containing protein [Tardiphaga sp. vice154]QDM20784.1 4-hydroxyphenylacetate 3-hydroxylase [Tardiphaga sp. vice154]